MNESMTVEKIVVKSDVREVEIHLKYAVFVIGLSDFRTLALKENDELDEMMYDSIHIFDSRLKCMKKAVEALSYAPKNEFSLRMKLRRSFDDDIIDAVMEKLISLGYVDDADLSARTAERYARSKHWGPVRIKQELFKKGYREPYVSHALEAVDDEVYINAVKYHITSRFANADLSDYETRCQIKAYLYKYGFTQKEYSGVFSEF